MSKVVYCVEVEGSMEHYSDIREVASALGVDKITKKDIKSGKYPQVSIATAEIVEPMDGVEELIPEGAVEEVEDDTTTIGHFDYELTPTDMVAINAIDNRSNTLLDRLDHDSVELYDNLQRIKVTINMGAGDTISDGLYTLLLDTLEWNASQDVSDTDSGIESIDELAEALEQAGIKDVEPIHNTPVLTNISTGGKQKLAGQDVEYPEVGSFKEEKYLKRFYKQLDDTQLDEWVALEGLSYKSCEHESINRMRKCMAILELHFPKKPKVNTKSKSKYSQFTTEQLVDMARKANLPIKDSKGSDQILRMYTIMSLREAGLIAK
jgi:hypothetical protein